MFCVQIDENKSLIIANATDVKIVGALNEQIIFSNDIGKIVAFYKTNEIKGFYKVENRDLHINMPLS